jgi:hypothetical protein
MPECDYTTCGEDAEMVVQLGTHDQQRGYCDEHFRGLDERYSGRIVILGPVQEPVQERLGGES